ncbi:hypothetical protein AgCh_008374 [Apium graveolens]
MARQCPEVSHILFADDSLIFLHANELVAGKFLSILEEYCEASCQQINFGKSSVIFSPNMSNDLKGKILEVLKIPESSEKGKYLGVPAVFGKNKLEMFNYIKERALKKMQGWKQKLISQFGREILIKHVVQAIPSYSMSCFLLPQKLINKIMMAVRNFWWGGDPSSKSVHRKKWDLLSKSKSDGGMGFRDFKAFNLALLAKQCWRLVINPSSFWARVLKGMRWQVGNGKSINFWSDKWIPSSPHFLVRDAKGPFNPNSFVSDFITSGRWNISKLRDHVSDEVISDIKSIPLSLTNANDRIVWHYNSKVDSSSSNSPLNLVKFNCDGAFKQGAAAIGVIGRNSEGKLVDGRTSCISAISSFQSELFAIREACLIARQNRLLNVIIESDCKEAIKLCSSDLAPPWDSSVLIEHIRSV